VSFIRIGWGKGVTRADIQLILVNKYFTGVRERYFFLSFLLPRPTIVLAKPNLAIPAIKKFPISQTSF